MWLPQVNALAFAVLLAAEGVVADGPTYPKALESWLSKHPVSVVNARPTTSATAKELTANTVTTNSSAHVFNSVAHRCPQSCDETGNDPSHWTVYHNVDRLSWCNETMLWDTAIYSSLNHSGAHTAVRSCTSQFNVNSARGSAPLDRSCFHEYQKIAEVQGSLQFSGSSSSDSSQADSLLAAARQMQGYLSELSTTCNETILFASSGQAVLGLYAGSRMFDQSMTALQQLIAHLQSHGGYETLFAQICQHGHRSAKYALGFAANVGGDATSVQHAVKSWREGECLPATGGATNLGNIPYLAPMATTLNNSSLANGTVAKVPAHGALRARTTCTTVTVASGDSCGSLATKCGITPAQFTTYNPSSTLCSTLQVGELVCCSAGTLPDNSPQPYANGTCANCVVQSGDSCGSLATECGITSSQFTTYNPSPNLCSTLQVGQVVCCSTGTLPDLAPKPDANGYCASYVVKAGDLCSEIAAANSLTATDIESYNTNTWGWNGCGDLQIGGRICLSTGYPPMPAPISNAVCGPQVNGTPVAAPGTDLSTLNECPLNACCDIWGQCGTTAEFCTPSNSTTGAPGTAAVGQNGCISNCGTQVVTSAAPAEFLKIAYFEGFDWSRPCLQMDVSEIDTSAYTHIHMAFATLYPDFDVNLTSIAEQFPRFVALTGVKRILSFGGWEFSTSPDSYIIFREAVQQDNRGAFVHSLINIMNVYGLDGVDLDWEYPGEPDIPGIPPSTEEDAQNYLLFLQDLKTSMQTNAPGKTLSVTAPASYWYLKNMPIKNISETVDYIVYMTYDLHGQWDYGNAFSDPGCPAGNCLRSDVNLTETINSLSMITKAGVPSNMIAVGVTSYGRSFQMTTAGCHTEMCTYTGPASGAFAGPCTGTPGYLAQGEIDAIIAQNTSGILQFMDDSQSNILVYDETQWVSYMDNANKESRAQLYQSMNFGGTADWAIDLAGTEGAGGPGDGEVYLPPDFWNSPSPSASCVPPCTLIPPPLPLPSPVTVTWTSYVTEFLTSVGSNSYSTVTSTYSLAPFTIDGVPVWPVTINSGDPTAGTWQPMQSINPPLTVVDLPPYQAPIPPTQYPMINPAATITTTPTSTPTGNSSTSTTSSTTVVPVFFPTHRPITIQPQPTISFPWPPPPFTTPTVTYSSGSVAVPTPTPCIGCGAIDCLLFGCGGECGLLACDGGCGIYGCGGGCGLAGCPGDCPLETCGGPGCMGGSCGANGCTGGDCSPSSCATSQTASNCVEYCTVTTNAVAITTTSCTSTTCIPTFGCAATGTTLTVTSTTEVSCPVVTAPVTYLPSADAYDGCAPCRWGYVDFDTTVVETNLMIRAMPTHAVEKRAPAEDVVAVGPVAATCNLASTVTMPAYTGPTAFIQTALAGQLPPSQDMSRWYSKTTAGCVPTITTISDAQAQNLLSDNVNKPTIDHVYEENWLNNFWTYLLQQQGWTCESFNNFWFNSPCSDLLQPVYDGLPSDTNWDFIGMTGEVNQKIKGLLGGDLQANIVQRGANARKKVINGRAPWKNVRPTLQTRLSFLELLALGCDVWTSPYITTPLNNANNRIYSAIYVADTNLAAIYKDWLTNQRIGQMMALSATQVSLMINQIDADLVQALQSASNAVAPPGNTNPNDEPMQNLNNFQSAFNSLVNHYNLRSESSDNVCRKPIELSWNLMAGAQKRSDHVKRGSCSLNTIPTGTITTPPPAPTPSCYADADPDNNIGAFCYCAGYPGTLPALSGPNPCAYTTLPPITTPPPTTNTNPYPYTWTDPWGDIIACETSYSVDVGVPSVYVCAGSSTTIYTAPTPTKPPPPPTYTFAMWSVATYSAACVDAHCRAIPDGTNLYAMTNDKGALCNAQGFEAKDVDTGYYPGGPVDHMVFDDGICGGPKPYWCNSTDSSTWQCADANGNNVGQCTSVSLSDAMVSACHVGGVFSMSDTEITQALSCTGPFNCNASPYV